MALAPLGFYWLWRSALLYWWLLLASAFGVAAFALRRSIAANVKAETEKIAEQASPVSNEWGPKEKEAWRLVENIARESEPLTESTRAIALMEQTVDAVAEFFHEDAAQARFRITLPEMLLLTERVSRDLRAAAVKYLPGAREIQISHLLWLKERYDRHGPWVKIAHPYFTNFLRLSRWTRPESALLSEATGRLAGPVVDFVTLRLRSEFTALLVRETGRAAIDLYSGRLRLAPQEIQSAAQAENSGAARDLVGPIRVLLAGQVNAGKSSLLNAIAGQAQRSVGVTPIRDIPAEVTLTLAGRPEVVLIDTPGIGDKLWTLDIFADQRAKADLILWVVSATQPASAPDLSALRATRDEFQQKGRHMPPVLCAVTHIDELRPANEWNPPYDLTQTDDAKAARIREAIDHIGATLKIDRERIVPVCVRDLDMAYNVDLLWSLIAMHLDDARFAKLDRLLQDARAFSSKRVLEQMAAAGRWLSKAVLFEKR
ncbi:GTPase family protein [Methylocystis heyeri]|uniref:GTPase family protein n=1 Tax=Methylocystis heyeri TaxID=391905 RepID=UPI00138A2846|nr:GTPase [Methylocystis heyeri]